MAETRKLAAILVSDVVGYSRLAGRDEELTLARLRALRSDLIDPIVSVHHGRIVKRTGDGALVEFRSVVDAVRCAIETQTGLVERNAGLPPERRIEFRIGIHLGDVMEEADGDLMGDGVNIAARLETMCEPGGICLSEDAYRQVRNRLDLAVTDLGDQALKNIAEPMRVYALTVGKPATARPAAQTHPSAPPSSPSPPSGGEGRVRGAAPSQPTSPSRAEGAGPSRDASPGRSVQNMPGGMFWRRHAPLKGGEGKRSFAIPIVATAAIVLIAAGAAWYFSKPSPPLGGERVRAARAGEVGETPSQPTSPSRAAGAGPSLSPLKGGEGDKAEAKHLSIVVLPFTNLSGDHRQDYFADGITENLTTDLSRIRNSFVIARNTAFTFKGKNVDAKDIGKELGVRYVLEGSVQRDGNRVRVNAQLIDAESGAHLWAVRFEEDLADLFKLQDDVVARLANSLGNELVKAEAEKGARSKNPDAIDLVMRGRAMLQEQRTKENTVAARAWFEQALKIDPNDADALAGDAQTYYFEYSYGWTNSKTNYDAKILAQADRAIALNPNALWAYVAKSSYLFLSDRPNESLSAADAGLAINPNFAPLYSAHHGAEVSLGRFEQAKSDVQQSMRLSPRDPEIGYWHMQLGSIELSLMHFDAAIEEEQKAINAGFRTFVPYSHLAADYALEGKTEEAKSALTEARRLNPSLTVKWRLARGPNLPILIEGLRKAGLPEDDAPRLSIVVLPFQNLSGDAKQDYLADVLTDELTTYISRIPGSFVIARNTAFTYKGKPTDVKQMGKDLGVRYALEGSVQPTDKRIRTNAQLIDTETGAHLWAEQFDTDKTDLLETEDEIVTRLARTLQIQMNEIEAARLDHANPGVPDAQELALRCSVIVQMSDSLDKNALAGFHLCEKALELDPRNVTALATLSHQASTRVVTFQSANKNADIARAEEFSTRALAVEPNNAYALVSKAWVLTIQGRLAAASVVTERALALSPSLIEAYVVQDVISLYRFDPEKTIESALKAMRLSPRDPQLYVFQGHMGTANFWLRRDDQAIDWLRRSIARYRSTQPTYLYLIAALALNGHEKESSDALADYLSLNPRAKTVAVIKAAAISTDPRYFAMRERLYDGLRKAGMPEQ